MCKLKKISLLIMFIMFALLGVLFFNAPINKIKADTVNNSINLNVSKVKNTDNWFNGKTPENIYENLNDLHNNESSIKINNNDVVSIKKEAGKDYFNDVVLISLTPNENYNSIIKMLDVSLVLTNTHGEKHIKTETYKISELTESRAYFGVFNLSSLTEKSVTETSITDTEGKYSFTFVYSYSQTGANDDILTETLNFDFYLINEDNYFNSNHPQIENAIGIDNIYTYNYQQNIKPVVSYNPYKFKPTINFNYNETNIILTTKVEKDNGIDFVILESSNTSVIKNQKIKVSDNKIVKISFSTLGNYEINYNLIINEILIDNSQTNLLKTGNANLLNSQTIYISGFETFYKNYNLNNAPYEQFYNDEYEYYSDFSYLRNEATSLTEFLTSLTTENKTEINNKISVTNQAPIKVNSYINILTEAKYAKLNNNFEVEGNIQNFSTSLRFEDVGTYIIFLSYKFNTLGDSNQYQVIMFKIETTNPELSFYEKDEYGENVLLNSTTYTNTEVSVIWNSEKTSPFSTQPVLKFYNGNLELIKDTHYNIITKNNKNTVVFKDNGNYKVNLKYGINHAVNIEKTFNIDNEEISFNVYSVNNNENNFVLENSLNLIENKITTNNSFAIFAKDKTIKNSISVKYRYLPLNYLASNEISYQNENDKLYIYNNHYFSNLFSNLDYINTTINCLTDFSTLTNYNFSNNTNAVIVNEGLYEFTIKDLANNQKTFFVLLDNSKPVVLHVNNIKEDTETTFEFLNNNFANLLVKNAGENLVSNNYSLIIGNGKAIKFNLNVVTDDVKDFATKYFGEIDFNLIQEKYIFTNYTNINKSVITTYPVEYNVSNIYKFDEMHNIAYVKPNTDEIEVDFEFTTTINNNNFGYKFNLNTDKNQILIYGYDNNNDRYYRIKRDTVSSAEYVYIRYIDDSVDPNYKLKSLTLNFYPFIENNGKLIINNTATRSYELLNLSSESTIANDENNGILSGGLLTDLINSVYLNGKSITNVGKYELIKTYENNTSASQTFYIDRYSPIEKISENLTIGKDIEFYFDNSKLSAENILYYILNNKNIDSNKLPIASNIEKNTLKYKNLSANEAEINKFKLNYEIICNNKVIYSSESDNNLSPNLFNDLNEIYTFKIYDNSGYNYYYLNGNNEILLNNFNANYISFNVKINNNAPYGNFIKNDNIIILGNNSSTNTNELSFVFEDSENDYLYDIDIFNLQLLENGKVIFQTYKQLNMNAINYFSLNNGDKVYYYSAYGNIFSLNQEKLLNGKIPNNNDRFKYTLTILNPNINSDLYLNGKSKEAVYTIKLNYKKENANSANYLSKDFTITIDHTAPYENVYKLIENDSFLTNEEKSIMKDSVKNKDRTPALNFDNYAFVITDTPKYFSQLDTDSIYIRKYNKYSEDTSVLANQSLVIGDSLYDTNITSRYKFDVNALDSNGYKIYSSSSYTISELQSFFTETGYYEIIEIDEAQNYTVYTVLYLNDYSFNLDYKYGLNSTNNATLGETIINNLGFNITQINTKENKRDYLNVNVSINGENHTLRYFPVNVNDNNITYFNNLTALTEYINNLIQNDTTVNNLGCQYIVDCINRSGYNVKIINNTPNELLNLNFTDYENKFILSIPENTGATYVTNLEVYPVIDNNKVDSPLMYDSNKLNITLTAGQSYMFDNYAYINGINESPVSVSIYYIEWTDNFGRTQTKAKQVGIIDKKEIDFGNVFPYQYVNDNYYTADNENVYLIYQTKLYDATIKYSFLPSTIEQVLDLKNNGSYKDGITELGDGTIKVNLWKVLNPDKRTQVKFIIDLKDLTTLEDETPKIYNLSYIYYPTLPVLEFTDSASNALPITPLESESSLTISTSKNVTLNYLKNTTLFDISINAVHEYINNLDQTITTEINNITKEYTFTNIGVYTVKISNTLGKVETYKFTITTANNKTYSVFTNEENMENYEIFASPNPQTYELSETITCDTYYTIFNHTVNVNTDFGLNIEEISQEIYSNTKFYNIKTNAGTIYKTFAVTKIPYNNNFLYTGHITNTEISEDKILQIYETDIASTDNLSKNLVNNNYIRTTSKNLQISLPVYNEDNEGNIINIKIYYNNQEISLNKNIYSTYITTDGVLRQLITLVNSPAGTYNIYFSDLAGNIQMFSGYNYLSIILLTEVITTINGTNPIDYQIYNTNVNLKIEQERQYDTKSLTISAFKNGKEITKLVRNSNGEYVFSEYGLYTITLFAKINNNEITKTLHFTILNAKEAFKEFSYIGLNGQTITKISRDGADVTNEIKRFIFEGNSNTDLNEFNNAYLYNINLASVMKKYYNLDEFGNKIYTSEITETYDSYSAGGVYEIFVNNINSIIENQTFSFKVWIRNENAKILFNSSIAEGATTTKAIEFTYNPYIIYSQIGESALYINDTKIIDINEESLNKVNKYTIGREQSGIIVVQIKSDSGNTEMSFIVYKKEPLSAISIVVIVIISAVVALAIIVFIKLRTKMKIK